MSKDLFDVAIVGYGPTGLGLANWLGQAGHRTVVIERWPNLYTLPRAGHVDAEVMRLFQRMGVAETIAADSSVTRQTVIRGADGALIAVLAATESDQGWEGHYSLFQPKLEAVLDRQVRDTGRVTVLQGWNLASIEKNGDDVMELGLTFGREENNDQTSAAGLTRTLSARWLVGADGANSFVRDRFDFPVTDIGYRSRALVVFSERLDPEVGASMPDLEVGMTLPRPYIALRESGKRFARWEFLVHEHETSSELSKPEKAWELIAPWGFAPENARLIRNSVFEFRTVVADDWRDRAVFLVGDAAHQMPPFQGQGMCSGQRDVAALAWRLDLVIRGVSQDTILDSYTQERKPQVLTLTINSAERAKQFWLTDPMAMRERDRRMIAGFASENVSKSHGSIPPLIDGFVHKDMNGPTAPAGTLSAQFRVRHRGLEILLDDVVGAHWLLLSVDEKLIEALGPVHHDVLSKVGARIVMLSADRPGAEFGDVESRYALWFENLDCRAMLVRPDSYIFGAAGTTFELEQLLTSFRDQLFLVNNAR